MTVEILPTIVAMPPVVVGDVYAQSPVKFDATLGQAGMWTGFGPPGVIVGAKIGDEYLDYLTGNVYTLNPGP